MRIKKAVKREFYLPHEELLDGKSRRPSSSIHRALTWRRRTPTAAAERTMSATGVRMASEKSRQLSASSPASSRASGGARVLTRWRGGRSFFYRRGQVFIRKWTASRNYAGAPGGSNLMGTWQACNILRVVPRSHARQVCRIDVPASPDFRQ